MELRSDEGQSDTLGPKGHEGMGKGHGWGYIVVNYMADEGNNRGEEGVATAAQMKDFVFDAIFLMCEVE